LSAPGIGKASKIHDSKQCIGLLKPFLLHPFEENVLQNILIILSCRLFSISFDELEITTMNKVFLNSEADVLLWCLPFDAIENCVIASEGPSNYAVRAEEKAKTRHVVWKGLLVSDPVKGAPNRKESRFCFE
jgi:hypothetical protein